jgi:hypothetical protein
VRAVKIFVVLASVAVAALAFRIGWELPMRETCSGDTCEATNWFAVDYDRVNWGLRPTRIACFEANPGPRALLIGPGDVCVSASGTHEERMTYEELRDAIERRRLITLAVVAAVLVIPPGLIVWNLRRPPLQGTRRGGLSPKRTA